MNKRILTIIILICFFIQIIPCISQVEIPLPESHWSYDEMAALAEKGLVPGHTSFDFKERRALTRELLAQIVSGVIDHHETHPQAFGADDLARLDKLRHEFETELARMGEQRATQTAAPVSPDVPTTHWAYPSLAAFARRGLPPDTPERLFLGGRIFTRAEMAGFAQTLILSQQKNPAIFTNEDRQTLQFLKQEFEAEISLLSATAPSGQAPGETAPHRAPWTFSGTSNTYAGIMRGEKTSITDRLTLDVRREHLQSYFSGTLDNSGRSGADLDFRHGYTFALTRRLVEYHTNRDLPERDAFLLAGDVNNLDFASGLAVGATQVKGAFFSGPAQESTRINAAWGVDRGGREFLTARVVRKAEDDCAVGFTAAREKNALDQELNSWAVDLEKKSPSRRLKAEYASANESGFGLFASWQRDFNRDIKVQLEWRRYRDFSLEHNNPPQYLGRSGGSGEDEKSSFFRIEWRAGKSLRFILSRDHIYALQLGRKTNVFFGQEYKPTDKWQASWGWEKETGEGVTDIERSAKFSFKGPGRAQLAASWKRSVRAGEPSGTTRFDISRPVFGDLGRLIISLSRRKSRGRRTNAVQSRFNYRLGSGSSISLSYDYSRTSAKKFDVSMTWKY